MAKKQKVNKTQAVRDYLKNHPKAMSGEIAAALNKQGIKITRGHVLTSRPRSTMPALPRKRRSDKRQSSGNSRTREDSEGQCHGHPGTCQGDGTYGQALGGYGRVNELLALIKEVGGAKKFKDLLEAMSTETDAIPF